MFASFDDKQTIAVTAESRHSSTGLIVASIDNWVEKAKNQIAINDEALSVAELADNKLASLSSDLPPPLDELQTLNDDLKSMYEDMQDYQTKPKAAKLGDASRESPASEDIFHQTYADQITVKESTFVVNAYNITWTDEEERSRAWFLQLRHTGADKLEDGATPASLYLVECNPEWPHYQTLGYARNYFVSYHPNIMHHFTPEKRYKLLVEDLMQKRFLLSETAETRRRILHALANASELWPVELEE